MLNHLDIQVPKILMFCGKGGVGKTTCAAATALHFAKKGLRVLLISTDPTPSLSDILEVSVGGAITNVSAVKSLDAVELECDTVIEMWKGKFGDAVYDVISSFFPVDEEIIEYIAHAPGIDEEFLLSYVYDLYTNGNYDIVIWDTAPAGGTLSLIKLQYTFYSHLGEATQLYLKLRQALKALVVGKVKKDPLEIISEWKRLAQKVLDMIRDEGTQAIIVTIPEGLGVNQTERVIKGLESFGVHIGGVLVNYILTEEACTSNFYRRRADMQKKYCNLLKERYGKKLGVALVPLLPFEVKGLKALEEITSLLFPT